MATQLQGEFMEPLLGLGELPGQEFDQLLMLARAHVACLRQPDGMVNRIDPLTCRAALLELVP